MKKIYLIIGIIIALGITGYFYQKSKADIYGSSLIGWWRFDTNDDLNGVTLDRSGNGYNGNLVNIATSTFYSIGKIGQGFNFDGVDDYISVPYNASLKLNNTGSVSLWVKPSVTSPSQTRNLITYGGLTYNNGYLLNQYDTSLRVYWMNGAAAITVNNAFTANTWSHIAFTQNNGSLFAYVNGVQAGASTTVLAIVNNYATYIGGIPTNWRETGIIDDARVYGRALSANEIAQLYNMGQTQFHSFGDF